MRRADAEPKSFTWLLQQLAHVGEAQEREIVKLRSKLRHLSQTTSGIEEVGTSDVKDDGSERGSNEEEIPKERINQEVLEKEPRKVRLPSSRKHAHVSSLSLRDMWLSSSQRPTRMVEEMREETMRVAHKHHASQYFLEENALEKQTRGFILRPNDPLRVAWDLIGMLLLFYDICTIPLAAFDPDPHWFTTTMDWTTQIFWTLDILMSLITGYVSEGAIVTSPWRIFKNYMRTWFILDLAVCGPDWVSTFVEIYSTDFTSDPGGVNRLLRSLRVVRTVRLLRLVKLKRILATIKDRITSEAVFILLNICKLILLLLLVNHFIAATWYLVGTVFEETHNWVDEYKMRKDQAGLGYRYSTSLHWSLTQFTPASMDVHPQNVWERYFAIMVLIAGLVLFSSFISSITGSMSQLRNMKADKSKQFWLLRRYLKQQKVPRDLCFRVMRYIEYALKTVDERVPEERITILTSLTDQLRNELKFFTHFRCLVAHPMFCYIRKMSEAILNRMSGRVLHTKELAAADPLFSLVDAASEMFFIQQGNIHYGLVPDRSRNEFSSDWETASVDSLHSFHSIPITDASTVLEQDDYLCEVAIWCNWAHVGVAQAMDETTVIGIDVKSFCDLTLKDADLSEIATLYSRRFVEKMSEDPTWVEVSHEDAKRLTSQFFLGREP
ncbi:unnamed protein product [Durusdinium trenchii]|uniref:Ion transport domain-containing protein n=2 Tax=Durusdinium trenchii TaxID=1381693 RepID=A0ABP0MI60_9DINO